MRTTLLAFHHVTGRHDGQHLAEITFDMLVRANIVEKVCFCFTITRPAMVEYLLRLVIGPSIMLVITIHVWNTLLP